MDRSLDPILNHPKCGQYTLYFYKCGHATSHPFHRSSVGPTCNDNCVYNREYDLWFYISANIQCSFCGPGREKPFGTQQPIPPDSAKFFQQLRQRVSAMGQRQYQTAFAQARLQYNRTIHLLMDAEKRRRGMGNETAAQIRRRRKQRHRDRWEVRRLRAWRRTEQWVMNTRKEQSSALKSHLEIGERPYITADVLNPHCDLLQKIELEKLPVPIDLCGFCQFPLGHIEQDGYPNRLPCGHMFHFMCVYDWFQHRKEAGEREVYKCPLCQVCFTDVREIPDFGRRYEERDQTFDSQACSSVLSASEDGDLRGEDRPPWLVEDVGQLEEPTNQAEQIPATGQELAFPFMAPSMLLTEYALPPPRSTPPVLLPPLDPNPRINHPSGRTLPLPNLTNTRSLRPPSRTFRTGSLSLVLNIIEPATNANAALESIDPSIPIPSIESSESEWSGFSTEDEVEEEEGSDQEIDISDTESCTLSDDLESLGGKFENNDDQTWQRGELRWETESRHRVRVGEEVPDGYVDSEIRDVVDDQASVGQEDHVGVETVTLVLDNSGTGMGQVLPIREIWLDTESGDGGDGEEEQRGKEDNSFVFPAVRRSGRVRKSRKRLIEELGEVEMGRRAIK